MSALIEKIRENATSDVPQPATDKQVRYCASISTSIAKFIYSKPTREDRLHVLNVIFGRVYYSTKYLTKQEASVLIEAAQSYGVETLAEQIEQQEVEDVL